MEPERIDWNNLDSTFVEDETYENFNAPKWVDLSAPGGPVDDEAWFCNSDCKHPKTAEDFLKSARNSKVKLLRPVTISEILPFKNMNRRDARPQVPNPVTMKTKTSNSAHKLNEDKENRNPNFHLPPPIAKSTSKKAEIKQNQAPESSSRRDRKPRLRSAFSAQELLGGRGFLNQITDFCTELKRLTARKGSKKGTSEKGSGGVLGETKERVGYGERVPLLVVKEGDATLEPGEIGETGEGFLVD